MPSPMPRPSLSLRRFVELEGSLEDVGVGETTLVEGEDWVLETERCRPVEIGKDVVIDMVIDRVELNDVDVDRDEVEKLDVLGGIPFSIKI